MCGEKITNRNACTCKTKVPAAERQFWLDQKTEKNVYWASGCKSNKENKNTISSPRKLRHKLQETKANIC